MKISEIFKLRKQILSFEVFPPKKTNSIETVSTKLQALSELNPDFISVTYGAGGGGASLLTAEMCRSLKVDYQVEPMMHLTCVNSSKEDVKKVLNLMKKNNIQNVLALRGDIVPDMPRQYDFKYASDLVAFIKSEGDFHVSGACYPECHPTAPDMATDIARLKYKVEVGAQHLVSQLFFDNTLFYRFMEQIRKAGIQVPVEAGIMPMTNKAQIEKMVTMCGASLPQALVRLMNRYESDPEGLQKAGVDYAIEQINDLYAQGVNGVHLYTMNLPSVAKRISESIVR